MTYSKQQIITEIKSRINGEKYSNWYIGITNDYTRRLEEHGVIPKENSNTDWLAIDAEDDSMSREIEQYFINLGTDGGPGGGDKNSNSLYVYKKIHSTTP